MFEKVIKEISDNISIQKNTYEKNGLKYCKNCNKPVETFINVFGSEIKVNCICACQKKEIEAQNKILRISKEEEKINDKILKCFNGEIEHSFEDDVLQNKKTKALKKYCDDFEKYVKNGKGILLFGETGTGKTFISNCAASELIKKGYMCYIRTPAEISTEIESDYFYKNKTIEKYSKCSLLIIDELGKEKNSENALNDFYTIINNRYRTKKPIICTSNLSIELIKKPQSVEKAQIYGRVLEMCIPIEFTEKIRKNKIIQNFNEMKADLFNE